MWYFKIFKSTYFEEHLRNAASLFGPLCIFLISCNNTNVEHYAIYNRREKTNSAVSRCPTLYFYLLVLPHLLFFLSHFRILTIININIHTKVKVLFFHFVFFGEMFVLWHCVCLQSSPWIQTSKFDSDKK